MSTPSPAAADKNFSYEAQGPLGQILAGSIRAPNGDAARQMLESLQLRIVALTEDIQPATKPIHGEDFQSFNQQLAHLTAAGLPVERGLRLIADEMSSSSMAASVRAVAKDLESGMALPEAFARHRKEFPELYGQLIDAGVKTNNLPGILLDFGRHMELISRLRQAIWRAVAYPIGVTITFGIVGAFIMYRVIPQFREIFNDFRTSLPTLTEAVLEVSSWFREGPGAMVVLVAICLIVVLCMMVSASPALFDSLILPLPALGTALKRARLAQWCNALRLGVEGGIALPQALKLAASAVGSPALTADTNQLIAAVEAGKPMTEVRHLIVITPSVTAALELASVSRNLPEALQTLATMFVEQTEAKIRILPAVLTPALMFFIGCAILVMVIALFLPLVKLIQGVSGGC